MEPDKSSIINANIKYFDELSSLYQKKRRESFEKNYARHIVSEYEKVLNKPFPMVGNLLDLGSGVGKIMLNLKLAGVVQDIYGIDVSQGMLKECIGYADELGLKVHTLCGDAEFLPFRNNFFEMVIGHAVLHHIPEVEKVFSEVFRILKPGGMCIFTEPTRIGSRIILTTQRIIWFIPWAIKEIYKKKSGRINIELHTFTHRELEHLALKMGFKKVFTSPYAGFISRIFYWVIDPIAQIIPFSPLLRIFNMVTRFLYLLDEGILKKFLPKDWFDEIAIVAWKKM